MLIALIVVAVAAAGLAAGCAYLWAERRSLRAECGRVERERQAAEATRLKLSDENRGLIVRLERAEADRDAAKEQFAQAQRAFDEVAAKALRQANEQLLQLAEQKFSGQQKEAAAELEQRKQAIEALIKPIRESLDKHAQFVNEIEKQREGAYHSLRQQLTDVVQAQKELRGETQNLVKALRRPEVRGRWGQMQLERVAELAGMIRYCDFETEHTVDTGDGRLRPDMVVRLPSARTIAVDAKTPIDAYLDSLDCADDESRLDCLERHVRQIETQVAKLAAKQYQEQFDRSPDFVVLFIPGESFLQAALQVKPTLLESAMQQNVLIASPTTLVSLLKAVAAGWREQQLAENAKRISDLGVELHERLATATGYVDNVGKHLENAVKAYNQFVGSYESRVLVSARKFRDFGADSAKELPADGQVKQVEILPRELRAAAEA